MEKYKQVRTYSKIGLAFVIFYLLIVLICFVWAFSTSDPKGKFVLLQLPVSPQLALIQELGLEKFLYVSHWLIVYFLIIISTILVLYYIGNLIGKFLAFIFKKDKK